MIKSKNDACNLKFGTGDINIVSGYSPYNYNGFVTFRNQTPRAIGKMHGDIPSSNLDDYAVVMEFNKIESIDVLIDSLNEAKNYMMHKYMRCKYYDDKGFCSQVSYFITDTCCNNCKLYVDKVSI